MLKYCLKKFCLLFKFFDEGRRKSQENRSEWQPSAETLLHKQGTVSHVTEKRENFSEEHRTNIKMVFTPQPLKVIQMDGRQMGRESAGQAVGKILSRVLYQKSGV